MKFKIKWRPRTPEEMAALNHKILEDFLSDPSQPIMHSHLGWISTTGLSTTYVSQTGTWTWSVPYLESSSNHIITTSNGTPEDGL